jgi:hypothetical protein
MSDAYDFHGTLVIGLGDLADLLLALGFLLLNIANGARRNGLERQA